MMWNEKKMTSSKSYLSGCVVNVDANAIRVADQNPVFAVEWASDLNGRRRFGGLLALIDAPVGTYNVPRCEILGRYDPLPL